MKLMPSLGFTSVQDSLYFWLIKANLSQRDASPTILALTNFYFKRLRKQKFGCSEVGAKGWNLSPVTPFRGDVFSNFVFT